RRLLRRRARDRFATLLLYRRDWAKPSFARIAPSVEDGAREDAAGRSLPPGKDEDILFRYDNVAWNRLFRKEPSRNRFHRASKCSA
ncbi:MAG TPA: hypothetical protein VM925_25670, partial [Labilithrix sp.]|nr:hypothetical protein [Labilithrix sp.]